MESSAAAQNAQYFLSTYIPVLKTTTYIELLVSFSLNTAFAM